MRLSRHQRMALISRLNGAISRINLCVPEHKEAVSMIGEVVKRLKGDDIA